MKQRLVTSLTLLSTVLVLTACSQNQGQETVEVSSTTTSQSSTSHSSTVSSTETVTSSSSQSATEQDDTGIQLESGQKTIDYAVGILGDKEWQVIEDNYNRTNSIPFNLLQGNDQSLYRVYQNGVITDLDGNIIHEP